MTTFLIVAIAFIMAGSKIAFELIRRNDMKNGLVIDAKEYTLWSTFKDIFRTKTGRERAARGETFQNHLKSHAKMVYISSAVYAAALIGSGILFYLSGAQETAYSLMGIVIVLLFVLSKSPFVVIVSGILSVLSLVSGLSHGSFYGIIPVAGFLLVCAVLILEYRNFRKNMA